MKQKFVTFMLAVHFYDPSDYTIGEKQYSDWGHTGAAGKKAWFTSSEGYTLDTVYQSAPKF